MIGLVRQVRVGETVRIFVPNGATPAVSVSPAAAPTLLTRAAHGQPGTHVDAVLSNAGKHVITFTGVNVEPVTIEVLAARG